MNRSAANSDVAVILAAHGSSKDVRINRPMFELAHRIKASGRFATATPAFLDGQPQMQHIVGEIGQNTIVVIPFMSSCGYYTDVVFPRHLASANKQIRIADPIGLHPDLSRLVHDDIRMLVAQAPSASVIVTGHGTRRNKKSCRTTIKLVQDLRQRLPGTDIRFAFIDQQPYVRHVIGNTADRDIIAVPFLMGLGAHTTNDLPRAFGYRDLTADILENALEFPYCWQTPIGGNNRTVFFAQPVGTYRAWNDLCVSLAIELSHMEVAA